MSKISVVGAIYMDVKAIPISSLIQHNSNPASIHYAPGGVGRNIAENLARLSQHVSLFGWIGNDHWGKEVVRKSEKAGIAMKYVYHSETHSTGVDISMLQANGELFVAACDLSISEALDLEYLESVKMHLFPCDYLIAETNLSVAVLQQLLDWANAFKVPFIIDPVSAQMAEKIRALRGTIYLASPNEHEYSVLEDLPSGLVIENLLISQGASPLILKTHQQASTRFPIFETTLIDPTGAGDALLAGVVYGLMKQLPLKEAIKYGLAAAASTIGCTHSVNPDMSIEILKELIQTHTG